MSANYSAAPPATLSRRFVEAVKLHPEPAYKLAWRAGMHPSILSRLIHGAERVRPSDARVLAVARELGLTPDECFAGSEEPANCGLARE